MSKALIPLLLSAVCALPACTQPAAEPPAMRAGRCLQAQDYACAMEALTEALKLTPDDYSLHYNRGYAHFSNGQYEQAEADYGGAIRLYPNLAAALNNRCLTRAVIGRAFDAAMADCDRALALVPDRAEVRDTRGFLYLRMARFAEAIADYDAALAINPRHARCLHGRGYAKARMGDRAGGEADMAAARAIDPDIARQYERLGVR